MQPSKRPLAADEPVPFEAQLVSSADDAEFSQIDQKQDTAPFEAQTKHYKQQEEAADRSTPLDDLTIGGENASSMAAAYGAANMPQYSLEEQIHAPFYAPNACFAFPGYAPVGYGAYAFHAPPAASAASTAASSANSRTVYIGGLPKDATAAEVLAAVKGGAVERFRLISEKNCAFVDFVDAAGAAAFYNRHSLQRFSIGGVDVKIGWAKATPIALDVYTAIQNGATRTIFLGAVDESLNEHILEHDFGAFGPLEGVRLLRDKRIAFVQYLSIGNAMKAMAACSNDERWKAKRIAYGKDHCVDANVHGKNYESQNMALIAEYSKALYDAALAKNRTVYLGNLPAEARVEDVCNVIRTGMLQKIRHIIEKNCAFVTFVDANAAQELYKQAAFSGLFVRGSRLKPGWGKPCALPQHLQQTISRGATRNVYVGGIGEGVTEAVLRDDFEVFGETEQINILREKRVGFVNFCNVESAAKAIEVLRRNPQYASLKLRYGRDRCGVAASGSAAAGSSFAGAHSK